MPSERWHESSPRLRPMPRMVAVTDRCAELTPKEAERLQRLRKYAYELQNRLDNMPIHYEMGYTRARLSAICWAVEKISERAVFTRYLAIMRSQQT